MSVLDRRKVVGSLISVVAVGGLAAAMFPIRAHLGVATTALVLVVPVVLGVVVGGLFAGVIASVTGFLVYNLVFIPPYYTLAVGASENWVALGVYVVVTVLIAQVVSRLDFARAEARDRAGGARRLLDLSELLVRESSVSDLLITIVTTVRQAFDLDGAALLLPIEGRLSLVASSGAPLSDAELDNLSTTYAVPVSLESGVVNPGGVQAMALVASGRAIGLLALRGLAGASRDRDLLRTFSNHLALALEREQLREQAVRAQLLEEVDRLRRSLVGAVSHDLRTPLATIKVSTSTLLDTEAPVSRVEELNLLRLIDTQADRLNRMVSNVLDMTRIQSGTLELRREPAAVADLVSEAFSVLGSLPELALVRWVPDPALPFVDVDHVLICQVLANLIDNATRHAPDGTEVLVRATRLLNGHVEVVVEDRGPGVAPDERASIFQMFNRREAGGRGGLGLAIAQAFVEAHGERIWVEDNDGQGARFAFTLPASNEPTEPW